MNQPQGNMQKYPSMSSVHTMASLGFIPPGHGYIPKKQKPEKPFGLPYITIMNRTHRGPGKKYLTYAASAFIAALLLFAGAALYFGHRNVSRMIVMRTEPLGALMMIGAICCVSLMGHFCMKARVASNRWRAGIRFRPEGLHTAAPVNVDYVPEMAEVMNLQTGTYGPKALREIPKAKYMKKKKKKRSRAPSKQDLLEDDSGAATPQLLAQQYAPQQYAPQQYAPQQYAPQQYAQYAPQQARQYPPQYPGQPPSPGVDVYDGQSYGGQGGHRYFQSQVPVEARVQYAQPAGYRRPETINIVGATRNSANGESEL